MRSLSKYSLGRGKSIATERYDEPTQIRWASRAPSAVTEADRARQARPAAPVDCRSILRRVAARLRSSNRRTSAYALRSAQALIPWDIDRLGPAAKVNEPVLKAACDRPAWSRS